eukprot:Skav216698  [mRNA]  locus=scaffold91:292619:301147:+ [translate_table: standard]
MLPQEMEFTPEDPRKGAGPVGVTGCIGINSYETAVVGLTNSYAALWEWKVSHFLSVPVDPKMEYRWEIEKDYGYYQHWPDWDTEGSIKSAMLSWWEHRTWRTYNGFIVVVVPKAHAGSVTSLISAPAGGSFYSAGHDGFIRCGTPQTGGFLGDVERGGCRMEEVFRAEFLKEVPGRDVGRVAGLYMA